MQNLDLEIGLFYLPSIAELSEEQFTTCVVSSLNNNLEYSFEIFFTAMWKALEARRMSHCELLDFMARFSNERDVLQRGIAKNHH